MKIKQKKYKHNTLEGISDVATILKYGTIIVIGGGIYYFLHKWGSFKFFGNFGQNIKTITKAPSEFTTAEGDVIDNAIFQIDKIMGIIKDKDTSKYNIFLSKWNSLKTEASKMKNKKVGFFKFYGSGKSEKELMANKLSIFRNKVLTELRKLG